MSEDILEEVQTVCRHIDSGRPVSLKECVVAYRNALHLGRTATADHILDHLDARERAMQARIAALEAVQIPAATDYSFTLKEFKVACDHRDVPAIRRMMILGQLDDAGCCKYTSPLLLGIALHTKHDEIIYTVWNTFSVNLSLFTMQWVNKFSYTAHECGAATTVLNEIQYRLMNYPKCI